MVKALLIVESPTKEKTIGKILGRDFAIKSSYGHIRDLPVRELGVDVEKGYEPKYVTLPKAKKIVKSDGEFGLYYHNSGGPPDVRSEERARVRFIKPRCWCGTLCEPPSRQGGLPPRLGAG